MTARKKQKNQAPTYWPSVVGMKELEKIIVAWLAVLKTIIMLAAIEAEDVDMVMPIEVEVGMAAMVPVAESMLWNVNVGKS